MKRKALALVLSAAMVLSMAACGNETSTTPAETTPAETAAEEVSSEAAAETAAAETEESAEIVNVEPSGQIVIGDISEMSGDISPYWTNNAGDYTPWLTTNNQPATVEIQRDGQFVYNMTILAEEPTETENEDGSKTYTFKLKEDLKWSNGEPLVAKEFVATPLLWCSKEATVDLGAAEGVLTGERLDGFAEYNSGEVKTFKGLRLLDDYTFSVTVDADYMPYYYGKSIAGLYPTYIKGWLPADVDIEDTEDGCKFTDNFTADYIAETMDNERYNLTASAGPYYLEKWDQTAVAYTLKANPYFPGDINGKKPSVETVIYKYVTQDTMMDQLKTGSIDILLQATDGNEINAGLDMVEAGTHDYISYDRNGYGQISFICDRGATQFTEVRQAIAYLLDRAEFCKTFTGGHGVVVNGPYGTGQWMVEELEDEMETLNSYSYSPDKATEVLVAGGWTLNENGEEWKEGDGLRYKEVDGELMPLKINWYSSENNSVSDLLVTMLKENPDVASVGMEITMTVGTFPQLLNYYYGVEDSEFNMFNLATGFGNPYDQKVYHALPDENGSWGSNYNHIGDEELSKLAADMNTIEEGDDEAYLQAFFNFIYRWNELLPNIPLYSNEFHDFFSTKVKNWDRDDFYGVQYALTYVTVEE